MRMTLYILYVVQAAQSPFPSLSKSFVVIGHSEGGGTQVPPHIDKLLALKPISGFLGAVAVSPVTDALEELKLFLALCPGMASNFLDFDRSAILTSEGQQCLDIVLDLGCGIVCGDAALLYSSIAISSGLNGSRIRMFGNVAIWS